MQKLKKEFAEDMKNNIFHPMTKREANKYYDKFSGAKGTSGTRIFEGDIESKYIKGGKGYQKKILSKRLENILKRILNVLLRVSEKLLLVLD